ncbi:MAG: hypothetical protein A2289_09460 [Deltaproteobacteria bacterium RIFOXYA12_FULL_58_15]|nr:MAG: hypothetical protein A2289_09460 [Deltaproteobacteria bacterium RIFOXYA12_FULL_58_15]OGR14714.1 MAG: hypothetical protein A2341_05010 [Deltaproteobacteria bacterium RIFOXYB12_FULL_58_9]
MAQVLFRFTLAAAVVMAVACGEEDKPTPAKILTNCIDVDGDGYGTGTCAGTDCNDGDADNWTSCATCVDTDADGYFVGCDKYAVISGPDCNDTLAHCTSDCTDLDADGWCVGNDCDDALAHCGASCTDLDSDGWCVGNDCNDADADNWSACDTCVDTDSDGYFVGCDSYTVITGPDCDDTLAHCTSDCTDVDSDGWCADTDCDDALAHCGASCTDLDSDGWCVGNDCNDADADNWSACDTCVDTDADGYFVGCDSYTVITGPDCDDTLAHCTSDCTDVDSDGWCADTDCDEALAHCDADCTDADSDGWCVGNDCLDTDANNWVSCDTCVDDDLDEYFVHCDAYTSITGPDCNDTMDICTTDCSSEECGSCTDIDMDTWCDDVDCNDNDVNNWLSCASCVDTDTDTYFVGCDAYVTITGPDCDDAKSDCTTDCTLAQCICVDEDDDGHCSTDDCSDSDINNWVSCDTCVDEDNDSNYVGCDAYTTIDGPDCFDRNDMCTDTCDYACCVWVKGNYSWVDISSSGADLGIGSEDDSWADGTAIGFSFPFFGQSFESVSVNTNGMLNMGEGSGYANNDPIPNTNMPDNIIAPLWDDLSASTVASTVIRSQTIPGPVARFVVTWEDTAFYGNADSSMTFQVILTAAGGIQFQYASNSDLSDTQGQGDSATMGVEWGSGTDTQGVPYSYDEAVLDGDSLAWGSSTLELMCPAPQ